MTFTEALEDARVKANGDVDVMLYRADETGAGVDGSPHAIWKVIDGIEFHGTFYPADFNEFRDWTWLEL